MRQLPNILTILRIIMTPLFIYYLFWGNGNGYMLALVIFILASITDLIDGKLARALGVESTLGKILDPLADKILVLSALISFITLDLVYGWIVALIVLRDVVITVIRFVLEYRDMPMATSNSAKGKTALQITAIIFTLSYLSLRAYEITWLTGLIEQSHAILILMLLTMAVTVYTGIDYLLANRSSIRALVRLN